MKNNFDTFLKVCELGKHVDVDYKTYNLYDYDTYNRYDY